MIKNKLFCIQHPQSNKKTEHFISDKPQQWEEEEKKQITLKQWVKYIKNRLSVS